MKRFPGKLIPIETTTKIVITLLLLASAYSVFAQPGKQNRPDDITIDTVKFIYNISGIDSTTSLIPQLRSQFNGTVIEQINQDIRGHFLANGTKTNSASYAKNLLGRYDVKNIAEKQEAETKESNEGADSYQEDFEIEHVGETFINIGYNFQVSPYKGHNQCFFTSFIYDLRKGKKLKFSDFFSVNGSQLTTLFKNDGYEIDTDFMGKSRKGGLTVEMAEIEKHMNSIVNDTSEDRCAEFYFQKINGEMQLLFKFKCYGPRLIDFGIPLSKLKPYIVFPEFRNIFKLWGTDIRALVGINIQGAGNEIDFSNYSIKLGGGYLIADEKHKYPLHYGIRYAHSENHFFYLFVEYKNNNESCVVLDVIEIKKPDMTNKKFVDTYCYTPDVDPEIIALVKTGNQDAEYYYDIVKAWRANRRTGKFEPLSRTQIKKCGNESFNAGGDLD